MFGVFLITPLCVKSPVSSKVVMTLIVGKNQHQINCNLVAPHLVFQLYLTLILSNTQFTDFHVDYSHGGGCKDFITIFPPVDGQTEFCGNLIILSPGALMITLISMMIMFIKISFAGKGQLYTFPREEPVTITFHSNE